MSKPKPLITRLRGARNLLREQRDILFDTHRIGVEIHRQDVRDDLDRFDAAYQALTEMIKIVRGEKA